ncbi:MAG: hypothetical protein IAI48_14270 [Candidatus Eremiobacteraeota bacterium]|nr:hypothetical protein [Candidatus Eremiobacteraeota bacterium]
MKRLVRSEGYARARLVTGALFVVLGIAVIVRTFAAAGLSGQAIPACVLGLAMILLGGFRFRDYAAARRARP